MPRRLCDKSCLSVAAVAAVAAAPNMYVIRGAVTAAPNMYAIRGVPPDQLGLPEGGGPVS